MMCLIKPTLYLTSERERRSYAEGGSDRICLRHQLMPGTAIRASQHYTSHQTGTTGHT